MRKYLSKKESKKVIKKEDSYKIVFIVEKKVQNSDRKMKKTWNKVEKKLDQEEKKAI